MVDSLGRLIGARLGLWYCHLVASLETWLEPRIRVCLMGQVNRDGPKFQAVGSEMSEK